MAMSPRKPRANKKSKLMTPEVFSGRMEFHLKVAKELDNLYREALQDGNKVTKNGVVHLAGQLKTKKTLNYKHMGRLASVYRRTYQRVRPDRVPSANGGIRQPVIVGDRLRAFFAAADLGDIDGRSGGKGPLRNLLATEGRGFLSSNPIASGAILTSLLVLYAKRHNLTSRARENVGKPLEQQNGQLLGVDEVMNQYLGDILTNLEQLSAAKLQSRGVADGQRKSAKTAGGKDRKYTNATTGALIWNDHEHAFRRDNFAYGNLQSIYRADVIKLNGKDPRSLNDQERAAGVAPRNFLVTPPELAKAYMTLVENAIEAETLGLAGSDYDNLARQAAGQQGLAEVPQTLALRAGLDRTHDEISSASKTYVSNRPKKVARKAVRKPKAPLVIQ